MSPLTSACSPDPSRSRSLNPRRSCVPLPDRRPVAKAVHVQLPVWSAPNGVLEVAPQAGPLDTAKQRRVKLPHRSGAAKQETPQRAVWLLYELPVRHARRGALYQCQAADVDLGPASGVTHEELEVCHRNPLLDALQRHLPPTRADSVAADATAEEMVVPVHLVHGSGGRRGEGPGALSREQVGGESQFFQRL
ncbi:ShlB/FhaC/HecB family hemolysin secretion/activation protein [Babesia caballi]|uniref:ShlB/FhaC/HecB family hemolysin secretion/activation protein n=1 Tax=Babesia caballi TaxID=5871 RepID=A0AAV4M165_BABCB|nr:ShlB/FhaC/HecB family hemolysin secretion/activation protein [Babesia caballi]